MIFYIRIGQKMSNSTHLNDIGISATTDLNESLFNKLLSCPIKRKLVLNIIASEKDNIDKYKRKLVSKTPLKNAKKVLCESPTMLYRKRVLEQNKANSEVLSDRSDSRSSSRQSDVISLESNVPSPELFENLLNGVIAYVEVRSDSEDRSSGVKMLMKSMGATVHDTFTRDVTHVIFKDGSFMTYQKAKLLNVHLLSVLWIEAVRSSGKRVPEKKFPALGLDAFNQNVSAICSQMQKEYETIIKDELRKSMTTGTPLPSKRVLIDRRRTIMTPNPLNYSQSMGYQSSQDREVAQIFKQRRKTLNFTESVSPELTSDGDSDLGAVVDGDLVNKNIERTLQDIFGDLSSMDLTNIEKSNLKENTVPHTPNDSIYNKKTPKYISKSVRCKKGRKKSINDLDDSVYNRRTRSITDVILEESKLTTGNESNNLKILSKNVCIASPNINSRNEDTSTSSTPDLHLSDEKNNRIAEKSTSTNMSSLRISSGSNNLNKDNAKALTKGVHDINKSDTQKNLTDNLCVKLGTSPNTENVTMRRKCNKNEDKSSSTNMSSLRISSGSNNFNKVNTDILEQKITKTADNANKSDDLSVKLGISPTTENVPRRRKKTDVPQTSPNKKIKLKTDTPAHSTDSGAVTENLTKPTISILENNLIKSSGYIDNPPFLQNTKEMEKFLELQENVTRRKKTPEKNKGPLVNDQTDKKQQGRSMRRKTLHILEGTPIKTFNKVFASETKNKKFDKRETKSPRFDEHVTKRKNNAKIIEISPNKKNVQRKDIAVTPQIDNILEKPCSLTKTMDNSSESETRNVERPAGNLAENSLIKDLSVELERTPDFQEIITKRKKKLELSETVSNRKSEDTDKNSSIDIPNRNFPVSRSTRRKTMHITERRKSTKTKPNDGSSESECIEPNNKSAETDNSLKKIVRERRYSVMPQQSNKNIGTFDRKSARRKTVNILEEVTPNNGGTKISSSSTSENSEDDSGKRRRVRKLYNPNDSLRVGIVNDETERQNMRQKAKEQKSDDDIFIQPNIISVKSNIMISENAKKYIDQNNIDIEEILNKEVDDSGSDAKTNKTTKKKGKKKNNINTENDEQRELLEEVLKKKNLDNKKGTIVEEKQSTSNQQSVKNNRKSLRLTQMAQKKLNFSSSSSDEMHNVPRTPARNRRSTLEFQTTAQMSANRKLKIDRLKRPSIVCTKLHKDQIGVFNQIVKKLGGFDVRNEITEKSTHLVAGEPKRTINMLRAIARGCWVLKHEWLLKSLEADKWLPEEDFEEIDFSPAVQHNRLQRQAFGPSYSMDIFHDCGLIYIARGSIPRCSDLRELVELCKGRVTTISRNADILVGGFMKKDGVICLLETWILDSITKNKKLPYNKYIISRDNKVLL